MPLLLLISWAWPEDARTWYSRRVLVNRSMADALKFDNTLKSTLDVQAPKVRANRDALAALRAVLRAEED